MLLRGLSGILKENKFDIINLHGYGFYPADLSCILKRIGLLKTPLVMNTLNIAGLKHGYLALRRSFPLPAKERIIRIANLLHGFTLGKLQMTTFDKLLFCLRRKDIFCQG